MRERTARLAAAAILVVLLLWLFAASDLRRALAATRVDAVLASTPLLGDVITALFPWSLLDPAAAVLLLVLGAACFASVARGRGRGLPVLLGAAAAGVVIALYPWSNLEWSRALWGKGVAHGGIPQPLDVLPAILVLAAAAWTNLVLALRATEARYLAKGMLPQEAALARGLWAHSAMAVFLAASTALGISAIFHPAATLTDWSAVSWAVGPLLLPILGGLTFLALIATAARPKGARTGARKRRGKRLSLRADPPAAPDASARS